MMETANCRINAKEATAVARPVFSADFETDAVAAGWKQLDTGGAVRGESGIGTALCWATGDAHSGQHCLTIDAGAVPRHDCGWQSPRFPLADQQYYSLTFYARSSLVSPQSPFWAIFFYDDQRNMLETDHYSAMEQHTGWTKQEYCFGSKYRAVTANIGFRSFAPGLLSVDDVTVTPVDHAYVQAWANDLYASMPAAAIIPAVDAGKFMPNTLRKLKAGGQVHIVVLGDSIANDLSNTPFAVLLEKAFPNAQITMRFTGRGSMGWRYFQQHVPERVLAHRPDLLVLFAMSDADTDLAPALRRVIDETRTGSPSTEVLLLTPHFNYDAEKYAAGEARACGASQRAINQRLAAEEQVEFIDLLAAWEQYGKASGKGIRWLQRDWLHMNEYGRIFTAQVIFEHFAKAAKSR